MPRVFLRGDPPPGPEVKAVMDNKGEIWPRVDEVTWQCPGGAQWSWEDALVYGPLVACEPLPDYDAAVAADAKRREAVRTTEYVFDEGLQTWHYCVPILHVYGGGLLTREDAERDCVAAIAFALEDGDGNELSTSRTTSKSVGGGDEA